MPISAPSQTRTVAAGGTVYAGRDAPLPAWLAAAPVGQWVELAGTSGAGGAAINAYSGVAVSPDGRIFVAAAGGHDDSYDNRVVALDMPADTPAWQVLKAPTPLGSVISGASHNADGTPNSRHVYQTVHYVPSLDRIFLTGARYVYSDNGQHPSVDAYHVSGSAWDAPGTWANVPALGVYGQVWDGNAIWTQTLRRYSPSSNTWTDPISTRASATPRYPWAFDSARQQIFGLCFNDGEGSGSAGTVASKVPIAGSAEIAVTINASAAYTQWLADTPEYAAMDYDPDNDRFLFYDGRGARAGRVFAITPNDGTAWDMSILTLTGTAPGATPANGVVGKFKYVPALKGFVLLPQASSNVYFFRVA